MCDTRDTSGLNRAPAVQELLGQRLAEGPQCEHRDALPNPRYRGICGSPGNAVFTSTPTAPPLASQGPAPLPGYQHTRQHPMYTTTHRDLTMSPTLANIPLSYAPRTNKFTTIQATGGNYEDNHMTTELDRPITGV